VEERLNMKRISLFDRARQRGVSLLFALLALAAMSLAAVALVRSVDGGSLVIGNLGFKQDTTRAADRAAELARTWLTGSTDLTADGAAGTGYYAQVHSNLDPTGRLTSTANRMDVVNWGDADSCACTAAGTCLTCTLAPSNEITLNGGSVRARYVITRLCPNTGVVSDTANQCAQPASLPADSTGDSGGLCYGSCERPTTPLAKSPYYRIVVRTVGARNTVSFTETIVH
jgi:type IV pilus assembly protein PilX